MSLCPHTFQLFCINFIVTLFLLFSRYLKYNNILSTMSYNADHPASSLYFENKKLANINVHACIQTKSQETLKCTVNLDKFYIQLNFTT